MLVIHCKDKQLALASTIYENLDAKVVEDEWYERGGVGPLLAQTPPEEPILIFGDGDRDGLYSNKFNHEIQLDPTRFDEPKYFEHVAACITHPVYILNKIQGYLLRKHNGYIIGIWPESSRFARRHKLHGLFTKEFYHNAKDAEHIGTMTLNSYIDDSNEVLYRILGEMLGNNVSLRRIPKLLKEEAWKYDHLFTYNFENFIYI